MYEFEVILIFIQYSHIDVSIQYVFILIQIQE
jgi:hypothetical protein